jgi:DNA-directed RNA polymerase beta' subunit
MSKLYIPVSELSNLTLYVLGSQDNAKDSFVDVKFQDASKHNMPYPNGVYDLHMGTTDLEFQCSTCSHTKKYCPGHPGVVNLKYPVQSPLFLKEIQKWLKCICFSCGKGVLPDSRLQELIDARVRKENILNEYVALIRSGNKNIKCAHCDAVHPHIVKDKSDTISIYLEYYDIKLESGTKPKLLNQKPIQLFPHEIESIFNKISNETVLQLGKPIICHPRKYLLRKIRAPPNTIRPDLKKLGSGRSNNNDVTVLLQYIIKMNEGFPDEIPKEIPQGSDMASNIQLLELHTYEMIKGSSSLSKRGISNNSKKPLVSIAKRLPRKMGRIRRNLMGRRANHMARSFITCDTSLRIDEVGIPLIIAQNLPVSVHVQPYNYEECMMYFMNGNQRYPGCNKIKKHSTGNTHSIASVSSDFRLEIGDIIERDLIDGDIVDFNRQPSLEPSSISSMIVRIRNEGQTICMNVTACAFNVLAVSVNRNC